MMIIRGREKILRIISQGEYLVKSTGVVEPPALLSVERGRKQEVSAQDPKKPC
jgi:hypothetical protein